MMKQRKRTVSFGAAALCGVLAMCVLAACAGRPGGQPTVTRDDLTQLFIVQDVLEQDAGNGKNYAYNWDAEDIDATMARLYESEQAYFAEMDEWLENAENMTPEELAAAGVSSIEQARERNEMIKAHQLEKLESWREYLEKQAALDPVISPQEAANRVGVIFEELYGVDLSQEVLELGCFALSADTAAPADRVGAMRSVWSVSLEEAADGVVFSTPGIDCTMDTTTGEIVSLTYMPAAQELEARKELSKPACYTAVSEDGGGIGIWNADDPSFTPMIEEIVPRVKHLLSGSPLTGGAQVTQIRAEVQKEYDDLDWNVLVLYVECDSGSVYRLTARMWYDPFNGEETDTNVLMHGFSVQNDAYN